MEKVVKTIRKGNVGYKKIYTIKKNMVRNRREKMENSSRLKEGRYAK